MKTRNTLRLVIGTMVLLSLVVSLSFGCVKPGPEEEEEVEIVAVHILDMTGASAAGMVSLQDATPDIEQWVNETEYFGPNVRFTFKMRDSGWALDIQTAAVKKTLAEVPKPVLFIGEEPTMDLAQRPTMEREKIPYIAGGYLEGHITPPGYMFTSNPEPPSQGGCVAKYFIENLWKESTPPKFAWFTWDNPHSLGCITPEAEAYVRELGYEVTGIKEIVPIGAIDTTPHLLRIQEGNVDFMLGAMFYPAAAVVIKDASRLGMLGDWVWGTYTIPSPSEMADAVGNLADDVMLMGISHLEYQDWDADAPYKIMYDKNQRTCGTGVYMAGWAMTMPGIVGIKKAIESVGAENVDGEAVYQAMQKLDSLGEWDRWIGHVGYSTTDRLGRDQTNFYINRSEVVILLSKWVQNPELLPGGKDVP